MLQGGKRSADVTLVTTRRGTLYPATELAPHFDIFDDDMMFTLVLLLVRVRVRVRLGLGLAKPKP